MNTPHQGVDILLPGNGPGAIGVGLTAISNFVSGWIGCQSALDSMGCFITSLVSNGGGYLAGYASPNLIHSLSDMTPGSTFLTQLNNPAQPESFQQAGIIGYTPQRWLFARELDEMFQGPFGANCNPEDSCGERAVADDVEYFYEAVEINEIMNLLLYLELNDELCGEDYNCPSGLIDEVLQNIETDAVILGYMDIVDFYYDVYFGCNLGALECEGSDGIVQYSSQYYPTVNGMPPATQVAIIPADSHGGATKSTYDHEAMDYLLQQFHVQTTASCAYAANPGNFNLPYSGGTQTFYVTTSPGCQWTVVSRQPWLYVNSGSPGTSNGTVSFTAVPNPLNVPRQASLYVSSASSTTSVSVTEGGAPQGSVVCTYALSPGYEIAVPGTGGTGSITVTTQPSCVWSAQSSASWLTVSTPPASSATGTGTGTFQYTAVENNTGADLIGTISVAGQNLTVLQGTTSGAAGSATVTISGYPHSKTVNECPPGYNYPYCNVTIQEAGAIYVVVNGQSYMVGYGTATDTTAALATSLAAQMNTPLSFITASVSGSTIRITASVDGVGTDYPLSTSFVFDTVDFSSPAFQATASGPNLIGGVN
jgi:hypothetical protein